MDVIDCNLTNVLSLLMLSHRAQPVFQGVQSVFLQIFSNKNPMMSCNVLGFKHQVLYGRLISVFETAVFEKAESVFETAESVFEMADSIS